MMSQVDQRNVTKQEQDNCLPSAQALLTAREVKVWRQDFVHVVLGGFASYSFCRLRSEPFAAGNNHYWPLSKQAGYSQNIAVRLSTSNGSFGSQ